jgi:hypothetical protein
MRAVCAGGDSPFRVRRLLLEVERRRGRDERRMLAQALELFTGLSDVWSARSEERASLVQSEADSGQTCAS